MPELTSPARSQPNRHLQEQPSFSAQRGEQRTGRREVELYVRTYTTLLQSSGAVGVSSLEPAHYTADSSLHAGAEEPKPDLNAFLYSANRIPACIVQIQHIVLGQTVRAFIRAGYDQLDSWALVSAPGRRRRWHWNGADVLAAYIASASDLDDLIPSIVAYQIEWNKMHHLLQASDEALALVKAGAEGHELEPDELGVIMAALLFDEPDWARLKGVWGDLFWANLQAVATVRKRMDLRMLGGTYLGYGRSVRSWWRPIAASLTEPVLRDRPVYFVSSNTHSIANTLSGVANRRKDQLTRFIRESDHSELLPELEKIEAGDERASLENLLYFAARPYFYGPAMAKEREARQREEEAVGIVHVEPTGPVDVGVQIIDLIVNINYPLGMAAYHIMSQVGVATDQLRGVYVLGKAATLNGRIGDIMLSDVVYDEHSGNTYWFDNCFGYEAVSPYLLFGAALDNQKAVTVRGTFLQNEGYLDFYYRENYTVVEMEAGPYLSALYEDVFLERHPTDEAINLAPLSGHIDLGVIHYASDTPYTRAHTLGARGMSFYGMDSTYASTIAILQRIFTMEQDRMSGTP
jgi:hypothetical protein